MRRSVAGVTSESSRSGFCDHLNDWIEYLCNLIDHTQNSDAPDAGGILTKYQRQLDWVILFREGLNASISINFRIADIYDGKECRSVDAGHPLPRYTPIQHCYRIDDSAFAAISKALDAEDLFLLQGPPGTGKTTAIVEIVLQTLQRNPRSRILICSETHIAVDNALERLGECLSPEHLDKLMRHKAFTVGYNVSTPVVTEVSTADRANQVWNRALSAAPALTERLWDRLRNDRDGEPPPWLLKNLADQQQIVGVTCNQLAHLIDKDSLVFDLALVDECSKATLPEWLMPASVATKCILVGDHKQLPATFCAEEIDVLRTLQEQQELLIRNGVIDRLFAHAPADLRGALTTQYRMRPEIGEVISRAFYEGQLSHGRPPSSSADSAFGWLTYCTTARFPAQPPSHGGVLTNEIEAGLIARELSRLARDRTQQCTLAVITPYRAQAQLIKDYLALASDSCRGLRVEVATIDAFQGREADIVLFSFVRNHGSSRFYGDPRRLNVALSRAKDRVILVGDRQYLSGQSCQVPALEHLLDLPVLNQADIS